MNNQNAVNLKSIFALMGIVSSIHSAQAQNHSFMNQGECPNCHQAPKTAPTYQEAEFSLDWAKQAYGSWRMPEESELLERGWSVGYWINVGVAAVPGAPLGYKSLYKTDGIRSADGSRNESLNFKKSVVLDRIDFNGHPIIAPSQVNILGLGTNDSNQVSLLTTFNNQARAVCFSRGTYLLGSLINETYIVYSCRVPNEKNPRKMICQVALGGIDPNASNANEARLRPWLGKTLSYMAYIKNPNEESN